jgi:hypothetical protein
LLQSIAICCRKYFRFEANIQNKNTREAYSRNINAFLAWCGEEAHMALDMIEPVVVAAYVEKLLQDGLSKPTVKQHLAAIRMLFDWMVTGGVLAVNPASAVRGPQTRHQKRKDAGAHAGGSLAAAGFHRRDRTLRTSRSGTARHDGLQLRACVGRRRDERRRLLSARKTLVVAAS